MENNSFDKLQKQVRQSYSLSYNFIVCDIINVYLLLLIADFFQDFMYMCNVHSADHPMDTRDVWEFVLSLFLLKIYILYLSVGGLTKCLCAICTKYLCRRYHPFVLFPIFTTRTSLVVSSSWAQKDYYWNYTFGCTTFFFSRTDVARRLSDATFTIFQSLEIIRQICQLDVERLVPNTPRMCTPWTNSFIEIFVFYPAAHTHNASKTPIKSRSLQFVLYRWPPEFHSLSLPPRLKIYPTAFFSLQSRANFSSKFF